MRARRYTVACLAGDGIGPELMAEASRAVAEVARLHAFRVDEVHAPFGGEAVSRFGHALPAVTREAYRRADAVLVAATREPALQGVKADLDLTWRIQRVRFPGGDVALVSGENAAERAFRIARTRRARVAAVGQRKAVEAAADRHPGVIVEHLEFAEALRGLVRDPGRFDVVVADELFAEALSDMTALGPGRIGATGRLSETGPGVFGPTHGSARDIAGQGVANPSGMLLAAALMLGEGLGERAAARTLERAVSRALKEGARTADTIGSGVAATTREFMDAVLGLLAVTRADLEFAR